MEKRVYFIIILILFLFSFLSLAFAAGSFEISETQIEQGSYLSVTIYPPSFPDGFHRLARIYLVGGDGETQKNFELCDNPDARCYEQKTIDILIDLNPGEYSIYIFDNELDDYLIEYFTVLSGIGNGDGNETNGDGNDTNGDGNDTNGNGNGNGNGGNGGGNGGGAGDGAEDSGGVGGSGGTGDSTEDEEIEEEKKIRDILTDVIGSKNYLFIVVLVIVIVIIIILITLFVRRHKREK